MSVINNQDTNNELEELKQYATEIGIEFRENIGLVKLQEKVELKEAEIAKARREEKANAKKDAQKKVKIIVEPRNRDEGINDQYFGLSSMATGIRESILIQFGEEVEVSQAMYEYIKNIKYGEKKFKMVPDGNGGQIKEWYIKKQSRFIVSLV